MKKSFIFIIFILFFSCNAQKKHIDNSEKINETSINSDNYYEPIEKNESILIDSHKIINETEEQKNMKIFLYENDESIRENNYEIKFIEKSYFGITEGDNWIVMLYNEQEPYNSQTFIYVINNYIIKKIKIPVVYKEKDIISPVINNLVGRIINNTDSAFGDFNNDGIDEIISLDFGLYDLLEIYTYNIKNDKFERIFTIPFGNKQPAIKYTIYDNMYGFNILYYNFYEAGDSNMVPDPDIGKWIFYAWNDDKKTYVRYGEIKE